MRLRIVIFTIVSRRLNLIRKRARLIDGTCEGIERCAMGRAVSRWGRDQPTCERFSSGLRGLHRGDEGCRCRGRGQLNPTPGRAGMADASFMARAQADAEPGQG